MWTPDGEPNRLGVGLAYRSAFSEQIRQNKSAIDWLEIPLDQYIDNPYALDELEELRQDFVIVPHCVGMSVGSDSVDDEYLSKVRMISDMIEAPWVTDHLGFNHTQTLTLADIVPVEWSSARARIVAENAQKIQDELARPFALENITYHVSFPSELTEAEFLAEFLSNCDCGLLLDVTNLSVNAANHGYDPRAFLGQVAVDRIIQIHLAGCARDDEGIWHDTHDRPVPAHVLDLLQKIGSPASLRGILIERDAAHPSDLSELLDDMRHAARAVGWSG